MDYNKNYYNILESTKDSSQEELKKKYRTLAKIHHPDISNNSDDKFKEISEAFEVLSDPKTRQEYDQRSPHGRSYSPSPFGGGGFEFHFNNGGGGDFFSQMFGGGSPFGDIFGGGGFNPFRREEFIENLDINVNINLGLKDIYLNQPYTIKFKKFVSCDDCNGTGFDKQSHSDDCEICYGTGRDVHGAPCRYCKGDGKVYTGTCKTCNGEKVILKDAEVVMQNLSNLRQNVRNAQRGFGHQSKYYREKVGNLILNIVIDRNDKYEIINNVELHKTIDIHFQDAIDGTEFLFNHIDDSNFKIKLPAKSKNNDILRIKHKGLLTNEKDRSDLLLKINIIIDYGRI